MKVKVMISMICAIGFFVASCKKDPIGTSKTPCTGATPEFLRDHALYVVFAPAENPKIAIAMVVENAGFGAAHAAPIARLALDYYLEGRWPKEVPEWKNAP